MDLGNRIRQVRGSLTQRQFADKIGVAVYTYQTYEKGSIPNGKILLRIHERFNVNITWLLTGEGSPTPPVESKQLMPAVSEAAAEYAPPIDQLIEMVLKILDSNTEFTRALQSNITAFYHALETKQRLARHADELHQHNQRLGAIEKKITNSACYNSMCKKRKAM